MIYLPTEYLNQPCYVINNGYIRVYTNNNLTEYTDIYVNQDYMTKIGTTYNGYNGVCDTTNTFTDSYVYRTDFADILIISAIMIGTVWFLISKLIKTFFRGFKRH